MIFPIGSPPPIKSESQTVISRVTFFMSISSMMKTKDSFQYGLRLQLFTLVFFFFPILLFFASKSFSLTYGSDAPVMSIFFSLRASNTATVSFPDDGTYLREMQRSPRYWLEPSSTGAKSFHSCTGPARSTWFRELELTSLVRRRESVVVVNSKNQGLVE